MTSDNSVLVGDDKEPYFHGFERSKTFENLWFRLQALEKWKELAIRPSPSVCHPSDASLLGQEVDDLQELQRRCSVVRREMNNALPSVEEAIREKGRRTRKTWPIGTKD